MSEGYYILIILAMAVVTYLPRLVPALFIGKVRFNPFFQRFLNLIPYAAMSALVFPTIFFSVPGNNLAAFVGTVTALVLAFFRLALWMVVVFAVLAVYLVQAVC